jgi:hypothetical protein
MSKQNIIINFQLEGFHNWPAAKEVFPDVGFLSDPHRHMFHFCCKKQVTHSDRDVEIIRFKREVINYLNGKYSVDTENLHYCYLDFGSKSCEMLSEELLTKFDLEYCSVLEDNENGSETWK